MVKNALEPQWEARFEWCSYGFRPGRSAHDAMALIYNRSCRGALKPWVIDADIRSAFDRISHEFLMSKIGNFPARELIKQWLKAGIVEENGFFQDTQEGTPQGGVISPLLANIALDGMEQAIPSNRLVRYADDMVIFCKSKGEAEEILKIADRWLRKRGLEFAQEKTIIVNLTEGFDFLGFHVRQYPIADTRRSRKGELLPHARRTQKLLITPSKEKVKLLRRKIKATSRQFLGAPQHALIDQLNPLLRGWGNYYRHVVASRTFSGVGDYCWKILWKWARRRHQKKGKRWIADRYWGRYNPTRKDRWVFGYYDAKNGKNRYLIKMSWIPIERYFSVKGDASPDNPELTSYWEKRRRRKQAEEQRPYHRILRVKQKGLCPQCGCELDNGEELHIHHTTPLSQGGKDHILNMQLLHMFCHQQIHANLKGNTA